MAQVGIDPVLLHWHFWETRSPKGYVEFTQNDLGDQLQVSRQRIVQVVADLVQQGRLKETKTRGRYVVVDPSTLADDQSSVSGAPGSM